MSCWKYRWTRIWLNLPVWPRAPSPAEIALCINLYIVRSYQNSWSKRIISARRFVMSDSDRFLTPRQAAQILGVSYPTIKQWIYHHKIRSTRTAGGHHRIPAGELDRYLHRLGEKAGPRRRHNFRHISGRNQLVGRVVEIKTDGLMAQV